MRLVTDRLLKTDTSLAMTVARLALGVVMFPHGAQKLLGWWGGGGFSATMESMTGMGLPSVVVFLVIVIESFGALALILGALTRLAALGTAAVMIGAVATVHGKYGFFMNWFGQQEGEGFEYHLLAIGLGAALVIAGAGRWSIDGWLASRAKA